MTRRQFAVLAAVVTVFGMLIASALPASASRARDTDPHSIDPVLLKLPASSLPAGSIVDHSAVSNNDDANAKTVPADGYKSQLKLMHITPYDQLGRISGYRMDFRYSLATVQTGTEYLASILPTAAAAQSAMEDAIGPGTLIQIIGQPLVHQCSVGAACAAYSGPVPGSTPLMNAIVAIYIDGPILIETATQVEASKFTALEPQIEATLYGFLRTADTQVQIALGHGPSSPPAATTTSAVTVTSTATSTPTVTPTPKPAPTKKPTVKKCKKGYKLVKGKCKKKH